MFIRVNPWLTAFLSASVFRSLDERDPVDLLERGISGQDLCDGRLAEGGHSFGDGSLPEL